MLNNVPSPQDARQPAGSSGSTAAPWEDEAEVEDFKPLTREQAQQWRMRQPAESAWRVVRWQVVLAVIAALVAWVLTRRPPLAWSVLYGGFCIALPSALMAYGMTSSALFRVIESMFPGVAKVSLAGVMFWEGVKVLCAMALLWAAPHVIPSLNWLALVLGLVVVLKAYWLEFWLHSRRSA